MSNDPYDLLKIDAEEFLPYFNISNTDKEIFIFNKYTVDPITVEQLEDWILNLKDKRKYKKFRIQLCNGDKTHFCCLGVLTDINNTLHISQTDYTFNPHFNQGYKSFNKNVLYSVGKSYYIDIILQKVFAGINDHNDSGDDFSIIIEILENVVLPKLEQFELSQAQDK